MYASIFKFDPSQPRDKIGRWTTANPGSGMHFDREKKAWVGAGGVASDEDQQRLRDVKMPSVYTDVRVNPDKEAELVAVGRDTKGNLQYRYSSQHAEKAHVAKFSRVKEFNEAHRKLVIRASKMLNDESVPLKDRDAAACVLLIDKTGFRNGGKPGADTVGASTLKVENVHIEGDALLFSFTGKAGVQQNKRLSDKMLAEYIRNRVSTKSPGDQLFDTTPDRNISLVRTLTENDNFKVHDLRTRRGTAVAIKAIREMGIPADHKEFVRMRNLVAKKVAKALGNTPAVALSAYIDPMVFKDWQHAEFIKPSRKVRKDDAELDSLLDEFYATHSYDEEFDWAADPRTDFDPDDDPVYAALQKEGTLFAHMFKREFSEKRREQLAGTGAALPDGSYPIVNSTDLRNAIQAVGRAKDIARAKAHIKTRAKALNLSKLVPEGW